MLKKKIQKAQKKETITSKRIIFNKEKIIKQDNFHYDFLESFLKSYENKKIYTENNYLFKKEYGFKSLWAIVMFQKWYDIFMEKN